MTSWNRTGIVFPSAQYLNGRSKLYTNQARPYRARKTSTAERGNTVELVIVGTTMSSAPLPAVPAEVLAPVLRGFAASDAE
jgi:hypothetical protein